MVPALVAVLMVALVQVALPVVLVLHQMKRWLKTVARKRITSNRRLLVVPSHHQVLQVRPVSFSAADAVDSLCEGETCRQREIMRSA